MLDKELAKLKLPKSVWISPFVAEPTRTGLGNALNGNFPLLSLILGPDGEGYSFVLKPISS